MYTIKGRSNIRWICFPDKENRKEPGNLVNDLLFSIIMIIM